MYKPAGKNSDFNESLLARLDSQDIVFIKPLRDYLEKFGVSVVENPVSAFSCQYHIVCGDKNYVKRILESFGNLGKQVLVISWDPSTKTYPKLGSPHVKLVLLDPQSNLGKILPEIFNFFFTGSSSILDLKSGDNKVSKNRAKDDKQRINSLIEDIFETNREKFGRESNSKFNKFQLLVILLILPIFWYISTLAGSLVSYIISQRMLAWGNSQTAVHVARLGVNLAYGGKLLVSTGLTSSQERLFSLLVTSGQSLVRAGTIVAKASEMRSVILSKDRASVHPAVALDRLKNDIESLTVDLGLIRGQFLNLSDQGVFPISALTAFGLTEKLTAGITKAYEMLSQAQGLLILYKEMGGFSGAKSYLVLFQNSMELRPTGGFIGSVGRLTMLDGKISDLSIWDVYELDGQLRGHVDPPEPIRTILGSEHWYLRDSNWDPDFAVSAWRAAWFYENEMGESVDGVIGLTSRLIPEILKITGPIELSDYNDRITSENFYGKALFYTREDFFPGSTQKKDFLGNLSRAIFTRLENDFTLNSSALIEVLLAGLQSKDIQLYFEDSKQQLAQAYGWAGQLKSQDETNELPLAIIEANLGVNKANFFVSADLLRDIEIDNDDNIVETVTFNQVNKETAELAIEDRLYKSYTRFYFNRDAIIKAVTIDGVEIPQRVDAGATQLPFWQQESENERRVIGVASVLEPQKSRRISVTYSISRDGRIPLKLSTRAQAGAGQMPLVLTISAPSQHVMTLSAPGEQVASAGQLRYNTNLKADWVGRVTFSQ